jgi:hypothetical protein
MTLSTQLTSEWHPKKNAGLLADDFTPGSNKKVWWIDSLEHEWEATINSRTKGSGCPYCSGRKVLPGLNDLATTHPEIAHQLHPEKNTIFATQISKGTTRKMWWMCEAGHEWETTVNSRVRGNGCPVCSGRVATIGQTDLATTDPDLASQWHPTKNTDSPYQLSRSSNKKAWWVCEKGHEWQAPIYSRTKHGCPYCAGLKSITGVTDLQSTHPLIAAQWSTFNSLLLSEASKGSMTKAWWVCEKGHEWEAPIYSRVAGNNCPVCWATTYVSKAETELHSFLTSAGLDVQQSNRTVLRGKQEMDLYIPSKKTGIEFNGLYWHSEQMGKGQYYHAQKYEAAKSAGIQLIQLWEDDWNRNPELVKNMLAHKLGISKRATVYARKLDIVHVDTKAAQLFLSVNHIQGFASGTHYLGLQDTSKTLKALMVLKQETTDMISLIRYATADVIPGGFSKLLSYAQRTYPVSAFITFADHCVSDGGLYEKHGFVADKQIPPDYMYVVRGERKHKFGYRLKKFRNDPNLLWEEGLTERELAALNKIPRIWDAGKTRYRLNVK